MENKKNFIINTLFYVLVLALIYFVYKYLLKIFAPFIIGFILAYISLKITNSLFKDKNNKFYKSITLLVLYIVVLLLITIIVVFITGEFMNFVSSLPNLYKTSLDPLIKQMLQDLKSFNDTLPNNVKSALTQSIEGIAAAVRDLVTSISTTLVTIITSIITYTPTLIVSIIVTIVSSFFFLFDYELVIKYVNSIIPTKAKDEIISIKEYISNKLLKVIKSYILIMFITFIELLIGFIIIGIDNYAFLALIICVLDILPVLGVGTVLIPWGVISLFGANTIVGIEIIALYIVITIIRNIIEPKLVGSNLGLHPLGALILMIFGLKTIGIMGMFLFPITCSYLVSKNRI